MKNSINVGHHVILTDLSDWLIADLPEEEQLEIRSYIGKETVVEKIDEYGYYWVGFGKTFEKDGASFYSGHSFAVTKDNLKFAK